MSVKPGSGQRCHRWVRFQFICLDEEKCYAWHDDCDRDRCSGKATAEMNS